MIFISCLIFLVFFKGWVWNSLFWQFLQNDLKSFENPLTATELEVLT
jgi:hypothetical protein